MSSALSGLIPFVKGVAYDNKLVDESLARKLLEIDNKTVSEAEMKKLTEQVMHISALCLMHYGYVLGIRTG